MTKKTNVSSAMDLIRSQRGFTLAELLVVVTVFAVLVGMTVPDYIKNRPQRLLNAEANRLAGTVRQARMFSLRDNEKVYLEFIPEIDMYRIWNAQAWRAYADPIEGDASIAGDPPGRNPDIGDYDGDYDGDGDFWWGDGGTPSSPSGTPEDPRVLQDANGFWYYDLTLTGDDAWDGIYRDPDALLMPTYPGNAPVRTVSPKLKIKLDPATGNILDVVRDFSDTGYVAGDGVFPLEVDLRMRNMADNWNTSNPIGKRNGVLSHFPLIFISFFSDGSLAASWDVTNPPTGFSQEVIDINPGGLGALKLHLQLRGKDYNPESYNIFDPMVVIAGDEGPEEPLSPYTSLSRPDSHTDSSGRVLTINNLTGRIIIRNFRPLRDLDLLLINNGINYM